MAAGGGGGGDTYLNDLLDVELTTPAANELLKYEGTGLWQNSWSLTAALSIDWNLAELGKLNAAAA